ncbi:MAG TPA: GTPase [Gemmataceae bacterium]|nr:GTPase [Gemmataceae bacterium]
MSRWRILVVIGLTGVPFLSLAGLGSYYLWTLHWGFFAWWPMALCMALGYTLGWYWQRKRLLLHPPDFSAPRHWTERDKQAWRLIEARAQAAGSLAADKLSDIGYYLSTAEAMAGELTAFYHPGAADPVSNLTVPEILTVIELAARDLAELVDRYVPGSHLLTIKDWRRAKQALDWYQPASNVYWAITALFSPLETGARFTASKLGLSQPWQMLQQNLLLWFYTAYIHRLGTYLIELNSGRLRIGAARYRELLEKPNQPGAPAKGRETPSLALRADNQTSSSPASSVKSVTIAVLGQVKAGKSSLINALLGEQRAVTDVLPATAGVERYELHPQGIPSHLVLLDTVGYGHDGPKADQLAVTHENARQADLILLVLHARNPARQADVQMLRELRDWFAAHPELKQPPLLAVATHIDLLSPSLEWSPPYDWRQPTRAKETNIQQALTVVWEHVSPYAMGVVPVCTTPGKVYGINEWLLPAVAEQLDEAHGVALLRCLRAEIDEYKTRKVFNQLLATAKEAALLVWQFLPRHPPSEG